MWFSIGLTGGILIFSEILPKNAGVIYRRRLQPVLIPVLAAVRFLMAPLSKLCKVTINFVIQKKPEEAEAEDEIILLAEKSAKEASAKAAKAEAERYAAIKAPLFDKDILPVIKQRCTECHGKDKQKGKLRLDSFAEYKKGADGEIVVVPKDLAKSELYKRINLPDNDDDRMPPKGNRVSKPVSDLIKRWIEQGAKQK